MWFFYLITLSYGKVVFLKLIFWLIYLNSICQDWSLADDSFFTKWNKFYENNYFKITSVFIIFIIWTRIIFKHIFLTRRHKGVLSHGAVVVVVDVVVFKVRRCSTRRWRHGRQTLTKTTTKNSEDVLMSTLIEEFNLLSPFPDYTNFDLFSFCVSYNHFQNAT